MISDIHSVSRHCCLLYATNKQTGGTWFLASEITTWTVTWNAFEALTPFSDREGGHT